MSDLQKEIASRVVELVRKQLGANPEAVVSATRFIDDLRFDSLDVVELVMRIEDEFGILIPDDDIAMLATVDDAAAYIKKHKPSGCDKPNDVPSRATQERKASYE